MLLTPARSYRPPLCLPLLCLFSAWVCVTSSCIRYHLVFGGSSGCSSGLSVHVGLPASAAVFKSWLERRGLQNLWCTVLVPTLVFLVWKSLSWFLVVSMPCSCAHAVLLLGCPSTRLLCSSSLNTPLIFIGAWYCNPNAAMLPTAHCPLFGG
jgi:hypothetical protein